MQDRKLSVPKGNAAFVPRGCYLLAEAFPDHAGYQSLLFFFDEQLIRKCAEQHKELFLSVSKGGAVSSLVRPRVTPAFAGFAHSMLPYLELAGRNLEKFLRLKFQEMLLHLLELDTAGQLLPLLRQMIAESKLEGRCLYAKLAALLHPLNRLFLLRTKDCQGAVSRQNNG